MVELDEDFEKRCLEDVRRAAGHLRNRMDELLRKAEQDADGINHLGEVQGMGLQVDMACARYGLLRRLARGVRGEQT